MKQIDERAPWKISTYGGRKRESYFSKLPSPVTLFANKRYHTFGFHMLKPVLVLSLLLFFLVPARADEDDARLGALKARAEKGNKDASWNLAAIYENRHDYVEAMKWWQKAASQGDKDALINIGRFYRLGRGVKQDDREAVLWYRKAADQGYYRGESLLGWHYRQGKGVPQNDEEAAKWFRLAAEQNDDTAQADLGLMYETGKGVKQDYAEAAQWYRKSSELNDQDALRGLGRIYASGGYGLNQDWLESYFWWSLAAKSSGKEALANREAAGKHLTPEQLVTMNQRVEEWKPLHERAIVPITNSTK